MKQTSINIQPIKSTSEIHNYRLKEFDYVRKDLSHKNESFAVDKVSNVLADIKRRYFETVGQKMQKKATPLREGVVVIDENTTMDELKLLGERLEDKFGIKTIQIHIHRDEGYQNSKEWKPNLHAHLVFDWTQSNGKSIRLKPDDMREMQTLVADSLGMKRGVKSDRKHLSAVAYKIQAEEARFFESITQNHDAEQRLESENKRLELMMREIELQKIDLEREVEAAKTQLLRAVHEELLRGQSQILQQKQEIEDLSRKIDDLRLSTQENKELAEKYERMAKNGEEIVLDLKQEIRQYKRGEEWLQRNSYKPRKGRGMRM